MNRYLIIPLWTMLSGMVYGAPTSPGDPSGHGDARDHSTSHRGAKKIALINAEGADVTLWKPDLTTLPLNADMMGILILPATGMSSYHAVVAEKDWGTIRESVIRYEYLSGKPSHQSPGKLVNAVKSDFEIVPDPLPREHYRYYAGHTWAFILRLKGEPLPDTGLDLETGNGTRLHGISDTAGRVSFRLPDDFTDTAPDKRDRRSAEFTVSAATEADNLRYETLLTARYHINPSHWQSTPLGLAAVGLGLLAGGLAGRGKRSGEKPA